MNSLVVTLFLNEPELICLHTFKWFQLLPSNTNTFICAQLNGFKYHRLTLLVLFAHRNTWNRLTYTSNSIQNKCFKWIWLVGWLVFMAYQPL